VFSSRSWSSVSFLATQVVHNLFYLVISLRFVVRLGASGTGRTTFVNTLCESEVLSHKVCDTPETAHVEEGIRIKPVNVGTLQFFDTHFSGGSVFAL